MKSIKLRMFLDVKHAFARTTHETAAEQHRSRQACPQPARWPPALTPVQRAANFLSGFSNRFAPSLLVLKFDGFSNRIIILCRKEEGKRPINAKRRLPRSMVVTGVPLYSRHLAQRRSPGGAPTRQRGPHYSQAAMPCTPSSQPGSDPPHTAGSGETTTLQTVYPSSYPWFG